MFLSTSYNKDDQIMKVEMEEACSTDNRDKEYIVALARKCVGKRLGVSGKTILKWMLKNKDIYQNICHDFSLSCNFKFYCSK